MLRQWQNFIISYDWVVIHCLGVYMYIHTHTHTHTHIGFPSGSYGKESACNAGNLGSIPGLETSSGGGHGNPLKYSCLENLHGQGSLAGYSPWGCKESDTTEHLSTASLYIIFIHLSVSGYLDCFYILAIVNNPSVNIGLHASFWISVFVFILDIYPGVELLSHMVAFEINIRSLLTEETS